MGIDKSKVPDVTIKGKRGKDHSCTVVIKTRYVAAGLNPRNDLLNHSPDGFNWGYMGSGPSQLAFAILLEYSQYLFETEIEAFNHAIKYHTAFRNEFIAAIRDDKFEITFDQITQWLNKVT